MKKNVLLNDSSLFFFSNSHSIVLCPLARGVFTKYIEIFREKNHIFFHSFPFAVFLFCSVPFPADSIFELASPKLEGKESWRTGSQIWKKVNAKMHNMKEKFEIDYSSFRTEVSKRRRSATTRELSKEIFFFLKDSIRRLAKEKKEEERNKRIGSRLTKEMFFRTCFSKNGVFRAEERGLVGWGYAEWRNLPFLGDLHQT